MDDQSGAVEGLPADAPRSRLTTEIFDRIEHAAYVAVGALISVVALISLGDAVWAIYRGLLDWRGVDTVGGIIERLLFVLMMAEILHTVRASMRSGGLSAEPFLIVGMIACIRRVLVTTLETETSRLNDPAFLMSMLELAVLGLLIIIMVISIYMLRRARAESERAGRRGPQD